MVKVREKFPAEMMTWRNHTDKRMWKEVKKVLVLGMGARNRVFQA